MPTDLGKTTENYKRGVSQQGRADRWKAQVGDNHIRVVPHTLTYFTDMIAEIAFMFWIHFGVGPEGAQSAVVCPRTLGVRDGKRRRCPICEQVALLRKTGNPSDLALGNKMSAKRRYLMNIIDLKDKDTIAKGIQVYEAPSTVHDGVLQWCNQEWGDILSLEEGRNINLICKVPDGQKWKTEYSVIPGAKTTDVRNLLPKEWKDQIKHLESQIPPVKPYEDIQQLLAGDVDYGEEGEGHAEEDAVEHSPEPVPEKPQPKVETEQSGPAGPAEPSSDVKRPDCFGQNFSLKSEKCSKCPVMAACKDEFLK
jgi:hypothetical protein